MPSPPPERNPLARAHARVPMDLATRNLYMEFVKEDIKNTILLPVELRRDNQFMLEVVQHNHGAMQYLFPVQLKNQSFMVKAVQRDLNALKHVSKQLLTSESFVSGLMQAYEEQGGMNLGYISEKDVALHVVRNCKGTFPLVAPELRGDRDIVLEASLQYHDEMPTMNRPWILCDKALYKDREFMLELITTVPWVVMLDMEALKLEELGIEFFEQACMRNKALVAHLPVNIMRRLLCKVLG